MDALGPQPAAVLPVLHVLLDSTGVDALEPQPAAVLPVLPALLDSTGVDALEPLLVLVFNAHHALQESMQPLSAIHLLTLFVSHAILEVILTPRA